MSNINHRLQSQLDQLSAEDKGLLIGVLASEFFVLPTDPPIIDTEEQQHESEPSAMIGIAVIVGLALATIGIVVLGIRLW